MGKIHKAKVETCKFTGEWLNPINKKMIFYHQITTDIGHMASCGISEKNSSRIAAGETIEYEIDDNGKIKLQSSSADEKIKKEREKTEKPRIKGQEAFLGYAWSYAKDLIISGKSMKDVEELNKVARYIYDEIGKMLNNE